MLRGVSDFQNLITYNTEHWLVIIYKLLVKYEPESKHPCNTHRLKDCMVKWLQHLNTLTDGVSVVEEGTKANICICKQLGK